MDPQVFATAWPFIQTHWHVFVDPVALGVASEIGKQTVAGTLAFVKSRLTQTEEGKKALETALANPDVAQAQDHVKGLLEKAIQEDPQFETGLKEKLQQAGVTLFQVNNQNADIEKQVNIGTFNGSFTM